MIANAENGSVDLCSIVGVTSTLDELGAIPMISRFISSNNQKGSGDFSVHHYPGLVEYCAANFLEKNLG